MKISILNYDMSNNSLGRAYILAQILKKKYNVEILGPAFNNKIWEPLQNSKDIKFTILSNSIVDLPQNLKKIDGDIIYAIKPKSTSYGYALLKKLLNKKRVILDEDDWDYGFYLDAPLLVRLKSLVNIFNLSSGFYVYTLSKLHKIADGVTVSNTFLQKKFGGVIIPHARDKDMYNVNLNQVRLIKNKLNPNNENIIMFLGSVRTHKGIDIIVKAIDLLKSKKLKFIIVGVDDESRHIIPKRDYIKIVPPQNFSDLSNYLSLANLIILPQKKSHASMGQMPAKIYDALALGIPVIGSNVSDIPLVLKDCGLVFEPDDYVDLSKKIDYILNNPKIAKEMGINAKDKFIKKYSYTAVTKDLVKIFEKFEKELK